MKADAIILCLANQMYRISRVAKVEIWKHLRNERMKKRVITDCGSHKEWDSLDQPKEFNTNLLKRVILARTKQDPAHLLDQERKLARGTSDPGLATVHRQPAGFWN